MRGGRKCKMLKIKWNRQSTAHNARRNALLPRAARLRARQIGSELTHNGPAYSERKLLSEADGAGGGPRHWMTTRPIRSRSISTTIRRSTRKPKMNSQHAVVYGFNVRLTGYSAKEVAPPQIRHCFRISDLAGVGSSPGKHRYSSSVLGHEIFRLGLYVVRRGSMPFKPRQRETRSQRGAPLQPENTPSISAARTQEAY
jgi:hypothetical protein